MRFVVFGAGAIGSGMGGHLHRTGHDVLIVGRPAHVNRISQHGLQLVTDEQTYTLAVPAVARAEDVHFTPDDVLLLCVKSQDTDRALVEIRAAGGGPPTPPLPSFPTNLTTAPPPASSAASANPDCRATKAAKMFSTRGNARGAIPAGKSDQQNFMNQVRREAELCSQAATVPFESPQEFKKRSREQHRQSPLP